MSHQNLKLPTVEECDERYKQLEVDRKRVTNKGYFQLASQISKQMCQCLEMKNIIILKNKGGNKK